jgi:hypothetical protein
MSEFPPSIIVDMFYATAAVKQWGMAEANDL